MGREALIKATDARNLEWDEYEKPVDRVVAIAHAAKGNEVGALMLRVEALDEASLRKAVLLVSRALAHSHRVNRSHGERIAFAVIREHLHPGCLQCGGKGELHREAEMVVSCHICGGTGLRRYTDTDRAALVGAKYNAKAYAAALEMVRDALSRVVRVANSQLTG